MPPQAIQRRAYANRKSTEDSLLSTMERVGSEEMGDDQEYAEGEKTIVKGLNGKKGSYDAYLIPDGLDGNSYTKDGKIINGTQYKV